MKFEPGVLGPAHLDEWDFHKCRCENNDGEWCEYCEGVWVEHLHELYEAGDVSANLQ